MLPRSALAQLILGIAGHFSAAMITIPLPAYGQEPLHEQSWPDSPVDSTTKQWDPSLRTYSASPLGPEVVTRDPCYWIVSSRGLPQASAEYDSGRLRYVERLCDGRFRATGREALAGRLTPGVPICIFIHGSFVTAAAHHRESAHTYNWIRRAAPHCSAQIVFYTWPSEARFNNLAPLNSIAVNQRGHWAENNAFYLADLIAHLPHECPICLVGHSHGVRVTVAVLHLIAGGRIEGRAYPYNTGIDRRYRAVLAAGAIDRHWLNPGQRYDFAVHRAEAMLNLVNRTDTALHFYHLSRPFARRAIAATGLTHWDRIRLGPLGNKVMDCDVTELIGLGHFWPNYYQQPTLADIIAPYVYFTDIPAGPVLPAGLARPPSPKSFSRLTLPPNPPLSKMRGDLTNDAP